MCMCMDDGANPLDSIFLCPTPNLADSAADFDFPHQFDCMQLLS